MIFKKCLSISFKVGGNKVLDNNYMPEGLELSLPKLLAVFRTNIKVLIILTHFYLLVHLKNLRLTMKRIKVYSSVYALEITRNKEIYAVLKS